MTRTADWCALSEAGPMMQVLEQTPRSAAYRVVIPPGGAWSQQDLAVQVMAGNPSVEGHVFAPGDRIAEGTARFENPTEQTVSLLAVGLR